MSTRMEIWARELAFLHASLSMREKTRLDAQALVVERMKVEELFRRRRALEEQEVEVAARLRALWMDTEEILEALRAKLELLHARREFFLTARDALRQWRRNPARVLSNAEDFGRLMQSLSEAAGHPECEEILYELQELQLEIEAAEHEIMEIRLRREELKLDAEELERHLARCMDAIERRLATLFFGRPKVAGSFFLEGRKPDPKGKASI